MVQRTTINRTDVPAPAAEHDLVDVGVASELPHAAQLASLHHGMVAAATTSAVAGAINPGSLLIPLARPIPGGDVADIGFATDVDEGSSASHENPIFDQQAVMPEPLFDDADGSWDDVTST